MPRSAPLMLTVLAAGVLAATGISAPRDTTFPGGSYFAILCSFSHRNNDDPIVHPRGAGPLSQPHVHRQQERSRVLDGRDAARR